MPTASDLQIAIWSEFQTQIANYFDKKDTQSILVRATAGSGKTTTIVAAAKLIPVKKWFSAIFLAFGSDIAKELKSRLPKHVQAKTLNSLGYTITRNYINSIKGFDIDFKSYTDPSKTSKILRELYDKKELKEYGKMVRWLVGMAKNMGVAPTELTGTNVVGVNGATDSDAYLRGIIEHHERDADITPDIQPTVFAMTRKVLARSVTWYFEKNEGNVDFDDQKWLAVILRTDKGAQLPCWKNDIVIIDEAQDVNATDSALISLVLKPKGIVMGVGDPRQSIFGFRGADTNAIEVFKKTFNATELPLSISYRCSKAVVNHAREIFQEIQAAPNAPEGSVSNLHEYTADTFTPADMVLCRNNAPLITFAFKLLRAGKKVFVKGRDIGGGLISLIDSLKADTVQDLAGKLNLWYSIQNKILDKDDPDNERAREYLADKYQTLKVFMKNANTESVNDLRELICDVLSVRGGDKTDKQRMAGAIVLSTSHKAKGLESDKVFILDRGFFHPRWIEEGSWQEEQENNLVFVARTRAKTDLVYINTKGLKID
jgi:superfamily I DNA/RNA helicase